MKLQDFKNPDSVVQRFWKYVDKSGDCWLWTGYVNPSGDGRGVLSVGFKGRYYNKPVTAPRLSYLLAHGELPDRACVCHHCDNPPCVNPDHLFLGTQADNSRDMWAKGRGKGGPLKGSECKHAKLREADVIAIMRGIMTGVTEAELADRYGVDDSMIQHIKWRKAWGHLTVPWFAPDRPAPLRKIVSKHRGKRGDPMIFHLSCGHVQRRPYIRFVFEHQYVRCTECLTT